MKKSILIISLLFAVSLCGCKDKAQKEEPQTIVVEAANAMAKNNTTIDTTSNNAKNNNSNVAVANTVTNNSAIKGLSVDASGNLVTTFANGATQVLTGIAGAPGPAGPQGPQGVAGPAGPQGPQGVAGPAGKDGRDGVDGKDGKDGINGINGADGANGSDGHDGVGIDRVYINDNGDLMVKLTNGEEQNAGNLVALMPSNPNPPSNPEDNTPDYEKIGYTLTCDFSFPIMKEYDKLGYHDYAGYIDANITQTLNSIEIKLIDIDNNNPSMKYKYKALINSSHTSTIELPQTIINIDKNFTYLSDFVFFGFDNSVNKGMMLNDNGNYISSLNYNNLQSEYIFTSSIPYVKITSLHIGQPCIDFIW